jgi:two-component system alkaline phosphatase synthesis response regulator PhoP
MKKILIVEDEKVLAEMYRDKFEKEGFEVVLGFDCRDGLDKAKAEKPDLILLDILLPVENGVSFLKRMREEPEISSIPVVAFSNYDDPETKKEALKLGIEEYLIKTNYTPQQIVDRVKKHLR